MTSVTFPTSLGGDGSTVTDDSNATTGLGNGGFRTRLLPTFTNTINIAQTAVNAAVSATTAPGTNATSTTSLTVATGTQTLTVQASKLYVPGMFVMIADTVTPANWMHGIVTAYNSTTGVLNVTVDSSGGSGTFATWTVSITAPGTARPSQAGNAGLFLSTNGTSELWASAGVGNVQATATASVTLTGTNEYVYTQMTAIGQAITLPAANTPLALGGPAFIIDNHEGAYAVGIRDNTGTLLMGIAPGGIAYVALQSNSTQAGVWSVDGSKLEPGLISIDAVLSGTTYYGTSNDHASSLHISINSNQSIHFILSAAGTSLYAYIVDNAGKQVTTPTLVSSGSSAITTGAVYAISATTFMLFFGGGASAAATNAVVLSVSGTTITPGTVSTIAASTSGLTFQEDNATQPRIVQLTSTLYVVSSIQTGSSWAAVCAFSVSGTTVTAGTPLSVSTANNVSNSGTLFALTATTALFTYVTSPSLNVTTGVVVTVSGTTCSLGTQVTLVASQDNAAAYFTCMLSATSGLVGTDSNTTTSIAVQPFAISGTTITTGTLLTIESSGTFTQPLVYNSVATPGAGRYSPKLSALSSTTAFLWYADTSYVSRALVLTVSGTTVTAGTILYGSIYSGTAIGYGNMLPFSTTEFMTVKSRVAGTAGYQSFLQPSKISGTAVTTGYGQVLDALSPTPAVSMQCSKLSNGDYVLWAASPAAPVISVFRSNGDAVNSRGDISMPPLANAPYNMTQTGNVSANRAVIIGNTALNGPQTSSLAGQTRILSVEIAA